MFGISKKDVELHAKLMLAGVSVDDAKKAGLTYEEIGNLSVGDIQARCLDARLTRIEGALNMGMGGLRVFNTCTVMSILDTCGFKDYEITEGLGTVNVRLVHTVSNAMIDDLKASLLDVIPVSIRFNLELAPEVHEVVSEITFSGEDL